MTLHNNWCRENALMYVPHKSWLRMNCNLIYLTEMSTLTQVTYNIIICSYGDACIDHVNYDGQGSVQLIQPPFK